MRVRANAKLNLTLDITGVREDGYHLLDTVMQEISLHDTVYIEKNKTGAIRLSTNKTYLPADIKNTAYHAAKRFLDYTGIREGVDIKIEKHIPSRAGMGGGSADAAAVLKALNVIFEARLKTEELHEIGIKIGADVPFCLAGGTCRCEGIGEKLTRLSCIPKCFFVICKPPAGVNTARAFAKIDEYEIVHEFATPKMLDAIQRQDLQGIARGLSNRFDEVLNLWQVQRIKAIMRENRAMGAMMTGSGTSVFGMFDNWQQAKKCAASLSRSGEVFISRPWAAPTEK